MLFVNYPLKVKVFYWTYFELWIAVTAFYLNLTVTLPSQLRWRLNQAIHGTTRSLQTFCLLPYCRWNLMPRMPPCHQKWCLDVKSGSHLSKLRIRKSERSEKYFQLIFLGQAKNEINNVTMVLQLLWNHGTIHWEHYWLNKKQLKKGSFLFLALRCLFLPQASPHPLAPQAPKDRWLRQDQFSWARCIPVVLALDLVVPCVTIVMFVGYFFWCSLALKGISPTSTKILFIDSRPVLQVIALEKR